MRWSPRETTSILLEYVRSVVGSTHHSGVSLATAQINKYFYLNPHNKHLPVRERVSFVNFDLQYRWTLSLQSSVSGSRPSCVKDHLSLLSSSLHHRSHHVGEVAGMLAAASLITGVTPGNEGSNEEEAVAKLAAVFTSQLRDALRDGMGSGNGGMRV